MAVVQNLSAAAGTSAAGGDDVQIAPVVIGSILGTAVGVATWIHILSATLKNKTVSRHNPYFSSRQEVKKNDL
ncbi:hypothetical protein VCSRO61_0958 [Vibrio cholerae]|nr:hypothetical protein VCSRO61_0958 [Vibrio cholerae]